MKIMKKSIGQSQSLLALALVLGLGVITLRGAIAVREGVAVAKDVLAEQALRKAAGEAEVAVEGTVPKAALKAPTVPATVKPKLPVTKPKLPVGARPKPPKATTVAAPETPGAPAAIDATAAKKEIVTTVTPISLPAKEPSLTKLETLNKLLEEEKLTPEQFKAEKISVDLEENLKLLAQRRDAENMSKEQFMSEQSKIRAAAEIKRADTLAQELLDKQEKLAITRKFDTAKTSQEIDAALQSITLAQNAVDKVANAVEGARMNARRFAIDQKTAQALDDLKFAKPEDRAVLEQKINKNGGIALQKDIALQKGLEIDRLSAQEKRMKDDINTLTQQQKEKLQSISSKAERAKIKALFDKEIDNRKYTLSGKQDDIVKAKEALQTATDKLIVTQSEDTLRSLTDTLAKARTKLKDEAKTSEEINNTFKSITQAQKDLEAATIAAEDSRMNLRRAAIKQGIAEAQDILKIKRSYKETTKKELAALKQQIKDKELELKNDPVVQANIKIERLNAQIKGLGTDITTFKHQERPKLDGSSSREERQKIFAIFSDNIALLEKNLEAQRLLSSKEYDVLNAAMKDAAKAQKEASATWWQRIFGSKK